MEALEKRLQNILNSINQGSSIKADTNYQCNICKDTEWVIDFKTNTAKPCKCREAKQYKKILENSGISDAFRKKTFNDFDVKSRPLIIKQAKKMAIEYANQFETIRNGRNNSIAFLGQVGAGKTHLSIAIANELMKKNIGVLYMQYRDAITKLKQNMIDEVYYQNAINKYKTASVLLVDDMYKGKLTESDANIMFEIVNYRYLKGLPMIVSSEYTIDRLIDFDEAIGSRIIEMCKGRMIEFGGQELNYRLG